MERCSEVIGVSWWPVFPVDWDDWSSGQSSQKLGGTDTSGLLSPLQPNGQLKHDIFPVQDWMRLSRTGCWLRRGDRKQYGGVLESRRGHAQLFPYLGLSLAVKPSLDEIPLVSELLMARRRAGEELVCNCLFFCPSPEHPCLPSVRDVVPGQVMLLL